MFFFKNIFYPTHWLTKYLLTFHVVIHKLGLTYLSCVVATKDPILYYILGDNIMAYSALFRIDGNNLISKSTGLKYTYVPNSTPFRKINFAMDILARTDSLSGYFITLSRIFNKQYWPYVLALKKYTGTQLNLSLGRILRKSLGFSFFYLQGLVFLLFIDACLTDDEPLWEPIEWSLIQTWILFLFLFAWIAENLIVSRYGSYTGRDKRVWMAWYKTFWLIEGFYILNYAVAIIFVIVPFYYELSYNMSFVYSWWNWYSKIFFFKFTSVFVLGLTVSYTLQLNIRWVNWKQALTAVIVINALLAYLIYTHFVIIFFTYFADPLWYQKTRPVDYIQLSHEPLKWGWGSSKKDHFTYHSVKTVLWFKNDGPFATSFLFSQLFFFICLFFLYLYWVVLFRRIYATQELPLTLTTYCISSLRQFFIFFIFLYFFVIFSYITNYMRYPIEFLWTLNSVSWFSNFILILWTYWELICLH